MTDTYISPALDASPFLTRQVQVAAHTAIERLAGNSEVLWEAMAVAPFDPRLPPRRGGTSVVIVPERYSN